MSFKMFNTSQWFKLTDEQREKLSAGETIDVTPDDLEAQTDPQLPGDDMENDTSVDVGKLPTGENGEETPEVPSEETPDDLSDFEIADLDSDSDDTGEETSTEEPEIDLDNLPSEEDEDSDDMSLDFEISDDNDDDKKEKEEDKS